MSESGEVLKEALQTARGEADILDALARRVEFVGGGEGEPEIPTAEALAGWLPMAPGDGARRSRRAPETTALAPDDSRRTPGEEKRPGARPVANGGGGRPRGPGRRGRVRLATLRRRPVRVVGSRRPRGQADLSTARPKCARP